MKTLSILTLVSMVSVGCALEARPESNIFEGSSCTILVNPVDAFVAGKLSKLGVKPVICSDAVFLRRVYLDVIGTLPTAQEARDFLQDQNKNKRLALIDRLLERDEFPYYWAMKWSDLLRVKAEFPINLWPNAAQAYHHWIMASIRDNQPYDQFVREMLTASGSNFRVGPVNFYRAMQNKTPEGIAATVALTFMGTRVESWPEKESLPGMAVFFSQVSYKPTREWKEEIVFRDPDKGLIPATTNNAAQATNAVTLQTTNSLPKPSNAAVLPQVAIFPDGKKLETLPPDQDPCEIFADWLITPENPWFTANIVNRVWSWFMGRGIIHEPDDIRPDNPPVNPKLLQFLKKEFVASHYNLKHLYRLILTSMTYQYSSIVPKSSAQDQVEANFGFYPLRRLDAEVLIDAINRVTGTSDLYTSAIPEPFTFIPENKPAIALPDGSITSPFLELFGRPARSTGMENERINRVLPTQKMHLLNSSHIQRKLENNPNLKTILKSSTRPKDTIEELYLTILSRFPTPEEVKNAGAYAKSGVVKGNDAWVDLEWALINSDEFLFRH